MLRYGFGGFWQKTFIYLAFTAGDLMRSFCGGVARSYFKKKKKIERGRGKGGRGFFAGGAVSFVLECSGFARGFIDWL